MCPTHLTHAEECEQSIQDDNVAAVADATFDAVVWAAKQAGLCPSILMLGNEAMKCCMGKEGFDNHHSASAGLSDLGKYRVLDTLAALRPGLRGYVDTAMALPHPLITLRKLAVDGFKGTSAMTVYADWQL